MKHEHTLNDRQAAALLELEPRALRYGAQALSTALDALIQAEQQRRGQPDPVTGAALRHALTQGTLLNAEFDPSLHGEAWKVGALITDVRAMIHHNERLGFARGDALLAGVVQALSSVLPEARIVRIHVDAFAALLGPISGRQLQEEDVARAEAALKQALTAFSAPPDAPAAPIEFDWALLELTCVAPAHVQVLGPLVWSEAERALVLAKTGRSTGIQRRRIVLDAAVPGDPTLR